jgi:hypothetical protein
MALSYKLNAISCRSKTTGIVPPRVFFSHRLGAGGQQKKQGGLKKKLKNKKKCQKKKKKTIKY